MKIGWDSKTDRHFITEITWQELTVLYMAISTSAKELRENPAFTSFAASLFKISGEETSQIIEILNDLESGLLKCKEYRTKIGKM